MEACTGFKPLNSYMLKLGDSVSGALVLVRRSNKEIINILNNQYPEMMINILGELVVLYCRLWEIHRSLGKVWRKCRISLQTGKQISAGRQDVEEH